MATDDADSSGSSGCGGGGLCFTREVFVGCYQTSSAAYAITCSAGRCSEQFCPVYRRRSAVVEHAGDYTSALEDSRSNT